MRLPNRVDLSDTCGCWRKLDCTYETNLLHFLWILAALDSRRDYLTAQDTMKPKPTEQASFDVIGIEARTNNAQEATADGAIGQQWQRLFTEGILDQIPDQTDESITVVYTNYASDWNGDYTYVLGAKVKSGTKAP